MGMTDDRLYECFRKVYDVFLDPPNLTENQEDNTFYENIGLIKKNVEDYREVYTNVKN